MSTSGWADFQLWKLLAPLDRVGDISTMVLPGTFSIPYYRLAMWGSTISHVIGMIVEIQTVNLIGYIGHDQDF